MKKVRQKIHGIPAENDEDPVLPGITIVSWRDAGPTNEWEFSVIRGEEDAASRSLIDALDEGTSFSLFDYSRSDPDAYGSYRWEDGKIAYMSGTHGRFGDLEILDREAAIAMARKQVPYNYGAKTAFGSFRRKKTGYQPPVEGPDPQYTPFQKTLGWVLAKLFP